MRFADGAVARTDDLRLLAAIADGKTSSEGSRAQDKGHEAELAAFVAAVIQPGLRLQRKPSW